MGGVGDSPRGGTLGVDTTTTFGMSTLDGLGVGGVTGTDLAVVGVTGTGLGVDGVTGTDFAVVVVVVELVFGFGVVGASVVVVSLSFDLNNPVSPLKKPFFFVVDSGAGVVVVGRVTGGKGLKSASA